MINLAIVTNAPPPYRVPIYNLPSQMPGVNFQAFFCSERQPSRQWDLPPLDFNHTYHRECFVTWGGRYINNNLDVISSLSKFSPDVIITDGFNPTYLYAFGYALAKGLPHIPMTDGTYASEQTLSALHRAVRRFVYVRSNAFISAGLGGQRLYESYGIAAEHCFKSCLCIDNAAFSPEPQREQKLFDFILCGQIESVKNPLFALTVALDVANRLHRKVKILFAGAGSQEGSVKKAAALRPDLVEAKFNGFAAQNELPSLYRSARVFLFPTLWHPWGVVTNEACATGLPVIVSPHAGVAGELVLDGENGFVCDLNVNLWAERAASLLTQPDAYQRFSDRSRSLVREYTFDNAASGILAACCFALSARETIGMKSRTITTRRVVIVERKLLQYRVALYKRLRALLEQEGIELQLLIGVGTQAEAQKKNAASLDWAIAIPTRYLLESLFGSHLCWQPFGSYARGADLVIVMHENKLLYNLWLLSFGRPQHIAFWGHGRNLQSNRPDGLKERFKRWTVNKVDWWFAYTESSAALVHDAGFPPERTTVVENAIDTNELAAFCEQVSAMDCQRMREQLGLGKGPIGLYLGSLYKEKRLDFLLDAAKRIREQVPGFQLLIVGAGSEQALIEAAAQNNSWLHYMGPLQDREKAQALMLADVMLNPGLVGLGVLDSFVSGRPMFTTDCGLHSPEISYLIPGQNGVMTSDNVDAYAKAVATTLSDPAAIAKLQAGARSSASRYTVENMAGRIRNGILACLAMR